MRRDHIKLFSPAIGREMDLLAYRAPGHPGAAGASTKGSRAALPVLVFPTSSGSYHGYEDFGMVHVLAPLLDAGKLSLYTVDSYDAQSWYGRHRPAHERAHAHSLYEHWILNQVVPFIRQDCGNPRARLVTTGCSFGAYHAANFTLKHPMQFKHALCMSGVYDIRFLLDGHHDDWVYFNNPVSFVPNLNDGLLDDLKRGVFITLVCGQGQWEERCLASTKEFWWLLRQKGIPNYMDLWGHDVAHDWPWWRQQIVHYMSHLVEGRNPWPST